MNNILKLILSIQIKRPKQTYQHKGFTLIELLVAMIIAVLVITPLLGFMIHVLSTDRQEQAKATSEQEIQTALDYISNDLRESVYIYDNTVLNANSTATPPGIKDQIPPGSGNITGCTTTSATCQPILVFWKRKLINNGITVAPAPTPSPTAGSTPVPTPTSTPTNDVFVYSLVAYYLITDSNSNWSNGGQAARIARFEVSDGVHINPDQQTPKSGGCTGYSDTTYFSCPDPGFGAFDPTQPTVWTKLSGTNYTQQAEVLVDFIDKTTLATPPSCPDTTWSLISSTASSATLAGFYTCIDSTHTTAQVYLRGNALARIQNSNSTYSDAQKTYFPVVSTRVQGRGKYIN